MAVEQKTTKTTKVIPLRCFLIYSISWPYTAATNITDKLVKVSILVNANIGASVLFNLVNYIRIYICYVLKTRTLFVTGLFKTG